MLNKLISFFMSLLILSCLIIATPADAQSNKADYTQQDFDETVMFLRNYLVLAEDGTLAFMDGAAQAGHPSVYQAISDYITQCVNPMILYGYLEADSRGNLYVTGHYVQTCAQFLNRQPDLEIKNFYAHDNVFVLETSGDGQTKVVWHWFVISIYLNNEDAHKASDYTALLAILMALIPDPTVSAALAASLGVISWLIDHNNHGRGVIANYLCPPVPPSLIWITSQ